MRAGICITATEQQYFQERGYSSPKRCNLVHSMIELAHNLGKRAVAEGIEDARTLDQLRKWGCDIGQGYFIGKPMPAAEILEWLEQVISLAIY